MRALVIETSLIILLVAVVYLFEPQSSQLLAYYHIGIAEGELWRIISASFCHTNLNHLLMNLTGLVITLALLVDTFKNISIFPVIIFNSIFISFCLFIFEPDVIWYVGLSGVLHGIFSYGIASDINNRSLWGYLLAVGIIFKVTYEQIFGAQQSTITLIEADVLVNAHAYGVIAGICFYLTRLAIIKKM
jgi:rhomboid family GlyGly-CTERM serine protease